MSVTSVDTDQEALTLTLIADFAATADQVWELWADPRKLERWWGPPTYPATFGQHEFNPGGSVRYYMTSPEGEKYHGWWEIDGVEPTTAIRFRDGFGDKDGNPLPDGPVTTAVVTFSETDGSTRMTLVSTFANREEMDQQVEMGMVEGITAAAGQMDALIAA